MYQLDQIRHVHLEISTLCNASCPWCPRNFWGYPFNGGYPEVNMSLESAKHIFSPDFLKQLEQIDINGNFGDAVMNPETPDIVEYFREQNNSLIINISTNGGARNKDFWQRLARANAVVSFDLDGLENTHHLYRQNTVWKTVVNNAKIFIDSGGQAVWKMIKFDHNLHQIKQCEELSRKLGFYRFELIDENRNVAPVFDKQGKLTHTLGQYKGETSFEVLFHKKLNDEVLLEDIVDGRTPARIECKVQAKKSVYIAANGDVSPCCWLWLYPLTYGKGQYHQAANLQVAAIAKENNVLEHGLEHSIEWFNSVEKSWKIPTFDQGRLVICNDICGKK